jgi:hypothetical protein
MMALARLFFLFALILGTVASIECGAKFGGYRYDASYLKLPGSYYATKDSTRYHSYGFNVCTPPTFDFQCPNDVCKDAGSCQRELTGAKRCFSLGDYSTMAFSQHPSGPDKGFVLSYTGGYSPSTGSQSYRQTQVTFTCDEDADLNADYTFQFVEEEELSAGQLLYRFTFTSPLACPNLSHHSSGWLILLLAVVISFVAFLAAGSAYKAVTLGARGLEMIPAIDFFRSIPMHISNLFSKKPSSAAGYTTL